MYDVTDVFMFRWKHDRTLCRPDTTLTHSRTDRQESDPLRQTQVREHATNGTNRQTFVHVNERTVGERPCDSFDAILAPSVVLRMRRHFVRSLSIDEMLQSCHLVVKNVVRPVGSVASVLSVRPGPRRRFGWPARRVSFVSVMDERTQEAGDRATDRPARTHPSVRRSVRRAIR